MSGKCQPGWTLLEDTCYKYAGGPMTYRQAQEFCKKDNATIPFIKNLYWFQTLTQYLEAEQEDWRYYDMVWVSDLDAQEDHCKVRKQYLGINHSVCHQIAQLIFFQKLVSLFDQLYFYRYSLIEE